MIDAMQDHDQINSPEFLQKLRQWATELGFDQLSVSSTQLSTAENHLAAWLKQNFHGDMDYMQRHGLKRSRPEILIPGTNSVITVLLNYYPEANLDFAKNLLTQDSMAYISRYALGRDYHGIIRKSLQKLIDRIKSQVSKHYQFRAFSDSAPVMEKPLAQQSGLGWLGKHTNLINRNMGSWFFLGEIYTDLPLQPAEAAQDHCGDCRKCMDVCPTQAIIAPYVLDARLCISYLTIEHYGSIPEHLRPMIGNRIYGCDDCQLFCPWNRFAKPGHEHFNPRHGLEQTSLLELFSWDETTFLKNTEGSPIRRIGFIRWQRNIAIALGNAEFNQKILDSLRCHQSENELLKEHVSWAIAQQRSKAP